MKLYNNRCINGICYQNGNFRQIFFLKNSIQLKESYGRSKVFLFRIYSDQKTVVNSLLFQQYCL